MKQANNKIIRYLQEQIENKVTNLVRKLKSDKSKIGKYRNLHNTAEAKGACIQQNLTTDRRNKVNDYEIPIENKNGFEQISEDMHKLKDTENIDNNHQGITEKSKLKDECDSTKLKWKLKIPVLLLIFRFLLILGGQLQTVDLVLVEAQLLFTNWTDVVQNFYVGARLATDILILMIVLPLLAQKLKVPDISLLTSFTIVVIGGLVWLGFSRTLWEFFLSVICTSVIPATEAVIQPQLSKSVPEQHHGKIFAANTMVYDIGNIVSYAVGMSTLATTYHINAGFVFFIFGGVNFLALLVLLYLWKIT